MLSIQQKVEHRVNKINEHQTIQHQRRIPTLIIGIFQTLNQCHKRGVLFFEMVVKLFSRFFRVAVETVIDAVGDID